MKRAATQSLAATGQEAPDGAATMEDDTSVLAPPTNVTLNIEGVNQTTAGGLRPPDTHGAVGHTHFVEATNSHVDMYNKNGVLVRSVSLNSFFNYTATTLFDPRVVYDTTWRRWIIIADAFAESATIQRLFIGVSQTQDPTGAFFIYNLNVNFTGDDFFDYPQLGIDQDAIMVTANVFNRAANAFKYAEMFAVAKARLYNGLGFTSRLFINLVGTLAPPIVLDQNVKTFLVAATPATNVLKLYAGQNLSHPSGATLTLQANVPVPAYTVPAGAAQPGTTATLDTLDSRFVNASTQAGNSLWQVHSPALSSTVARAKPRFYEINTATNAVGQTGQFSRSGSSHDWNASIVGNAAREVFVTWSSTDPPAAINAEVRFSGRQPADPAGVIGPGSSLFTSPTFYTGGRWGDYSAVTVDPQAYAGCAAEKRAWIVNEKINASNLWGTRIGRIGFC